MENGSQSILPPAPSVTSSQHMCKNKAQFTLVRRNSLAPGITLSHYTKSVPEVYFLLPFIFIKLSRLFLSIKIMHTKLFKIKLFIPIMGAVCSVTQPCLTLWDPTDYSPPGSSVHGNIQARTLEWVAISFSKGSSWPRDWNHVSCVSCIGRRN